MSVYTVARTDPNCLSEKTSRPFREAESKIKGGKISFVPSVYKRIYLFSCLQNIFCCSETVQHCIVRSKEIMDKLSVPFLQQPKEKYFFAK